MPLDVYISSALLEVCNGDEEMNDALGFKQCDFLFQALTPQTNSPAAPVRLS